MKYITRIADSQISNELSLFGGLLVEGPKWCGKTWAARNACKSEYAVADPAGNFRNRELALLNPQSALIGAQPHLIDEWQEVVALWDTVRFEIDRTGEKGQFILTGSSTPSDERIFHSGAGRIGRIRLETMTLTELGLVEPNISLGKLLAGDINWESGQYIGRFDLQKITDILTRGGWPGLINTATEGCTTVLDSYLKDISEVDMSKIDNKRRNPDKVMAIIRSLSRNIATTVKYATIAKDISAFSSTAITEDTAADYYECLKRLFLAHDILAWDPPLKSAARLRRAPKRILADSSLAVAALGANPKALMEDPKLVGSLFENLVIHDLIVYACANQAKVKHYQDNSGLEVDAIIEKTDGTWGGIEIKLGYYKEDEAASSLLKLKNKLELTRQKEPAFLAVVVGIGSYSKIRSDGVLVIPIDHLTL